MRMGNDPVVGEAAELVPHRVEFGIVKRLGGPQALRQVLDEASPQHPRIIALHPSDRGAQALRRLLEAEILGQENLVLAHRQPARQLAEDLDRGEFGHDPVDRVGPAAAVRPGVHCLQRGDAGGDQGKAVRGALLGVDRGRLRREARAVSAAARKTWAAEGTRRSSHAFRMERADGHAGPPARATPTVPASMRRAISPEARPSRLASTSSLCSPLRGAGRGERRSRCGSEANAPAVG